MIKDVNALFLVWFPSNLTEVCASQSVKFWASSEKQLKFDEKSSQQHFSDLTWAQKHSVRSLHHLF